MLWCSIERMLTWGWISSGTTEATSSFPHSGASEICSFRECSAELLGKKKTGNSGQEAFLAAHHSLTFLPFLRPLQGSKKREAFPTQKSVYYFYIQKRGKINRRENFPK